MVEAAAVGARPARLTPCCGRCAEVLVVAQPAARGEVEAGVADDVLVGEQR